VTRDHVLAFALEGRRALACCCASAQASQRHPWLT
jgi:hypothetical protein